MSCLSQVFPQELGILAALPPAPTCTSVPPLTQPRAERPPVGVESARSPRPVGHRWARSGRGWGDLEGPGRASYKRQTNYKVAISLTWVAKDMMPRTFRTPSLTQRCDPRSCPSSPVSGSGSTALLPSLPTLSFPPQGTRCSLCLDCPPRVASSNFAFSGRPSLNPLAKRHPIQSPYLLPFGPIALAEIL